MTIQKYSQTEKEIILKQIKELYTKLKEKQKDKFYPRDKLVKIAKKIESIYDSLQLNRFYFYEPLPHLLSFHQSLQKERLIIGGNRSGKTHAGCWEALAVALGYEKYRKITRANEPKIGWIVSISNETQRDIIQKKIELLLPASEVKDIIKRDGRRDFWDTMYLKNGSEIHFKNAEQNRRKFQGAGIDFCWVDEEIPEDIMSEIKMRLIDKDGLLWITLTPIEGYTYIDEYLDLAEDFPEEIGIWNIDTRDNYHLEERVINRLTAGMTEEEKLIRLTGSGTKEAEKVYPQLAKNDFYVSSQDIYVNPEKDVVVAGMDVGTDDPTAVLFAKIDQLNNVYIFDEFYEAGLLLPEACRKIGMLLQKYKKLLYIVVDQSVLRRDPITGRSYLDIIRESFNEVGATNVNILMSGKNKSILTGVSIVHLYLDNTLRHKGREMLIVSDKCKWLKYEAKRYRWKDIGKSKGVADHLMDALRYLLERRPKPFLDRDSHTELVYSAKGKSAWWRRRRVNHIRRDRYRGIDDKTKY